MAQFSRPRTPGRCRDAGDRARWRSSYPGADSGHTRAALAGRQLLAVARYQRRDRTAPHVIPIAVSHCRHSGPPAAARRSARLAPGADAGRLHCRRTVERARAQDPLTVARRAICVLGAARRTAAGAHLRLLQCVSCTLAARSPSAVAEVRRHWHRAGTRDAARDQRAGLRRVVPGLVAGGADAQRRRALGDDPLQHRLHDPGARVAGAQCVRTARRPAQDPRDSLRDGGRHRADRGPANAGRARCRVTRQRSAVGMGAGNPVALRDSSVARLCGRQAPGDGDSGTPAPQRPRTSWCAAAW